MKRFHYRNGDRDPTANIAIANVDREARMKKEKQRYRRGIETLSEEDIKRMDARKNGAESFIEYLERKAANEEHNTGLK